MLTLNSFSQTQAEMNQEAYDLFNEAEKELNDVYNKILIEYKSDSIFLESLKKSQRIWIKFRDSELEMKYPNYKTPYYGSSHPMCRAFYLKELTEERTEKLKVWINGIEEGVMCSGSVKLKSELDQMHYSKAYIEKDSTIWIPQSMKSEHRIFGYKDKNVSSEKLILVSVFTKDVENNPFKCKYGSYYHTQSMNDLVLKYLKTENDFMKIAILKEGRTIDVVYMEKKWFEFDKE